MQLQVGFFNNLGATHHPSVQLSVVTPFPIMICTSRLVPLTQLSLPRSIYIFVRFL